MKLFSYYSFDILIKKIATITYPKGLGKFLGGEISTHEQFLELFSNFTWSQDNLTLEQEHIVSHWSNPHSDGVLLNLLCYLLYNVSESKL